MSMFILSMNMIFIFTSHPMSMGMVLILQTLLMSINSGIMMNSFWMPYILVITMLSGMLVLFIYMSSIASNEKFKTNMKMLIMTLMMMLLSILFLFYLKKMIIKNNYFSMEMILKEETFLNKMFYKKNMYITIMMVMYLYMTMIASTKLVNIFEGPMRLKT